MSAAATVLMTVATAFTSQAEVVTDYTESFSDLAIGYSKFAPRGWKHSISSDYYANTYVSHADGGHSTGWLEAKKPSSTYYFDGFVSPRVTGDVSIWVKLTQADGYVKFFTSSDGQTIGYSYSATEYSGTINGNNNLTQDEWRQITLPNVPANTYLAIVPVNCGICDFSAASADVVYQNKLELGLTKNVTTPLEANSDNQVTMNVKLKFTNTGDYDVAPNTPDFNVTVLNTNTNEVFATVPVTVGVPRNSVVEMDALITGPANLAPGTTSNNFKFTESLTGAYTSSYFQIIPFAPVYNFVMAENGTHSITERISFGMTTAAKERTFYVHNSGTDALQVTGISTFGDYEVIGATTGTVSAGGNMPVTVRYKASATGMANGGLTINTDKLGDFSYALEGLRRDENKYFESFEGATLPAGYLFDSNWTLASDNADFQSEGNMQWAYQSYSSAQAMTMPLMQFAQGENLYIYANKSDNTSANVEVLVSPDRLNWTSIYKIGASSSTSNVDDYFGNEPPSETGTGYGKYAFGLYTIPVPEGTQYVRFRAGGVRIHDIYGGVNVPVAHDMMYVKHAAPAAGMVNNPHSSTVTLKNVGTQAEEGYTVALMVDGEVAAIADNVEYPGGTEMTFPITYYPHETGVKTAFYRFSNGDYTLDTPEFTFNVAAETATKTIQVGERLISQNGIINPYYKNSASQLLITPTRMGITSGSTITGMHINGYMSQPIAGSLRIWLANATEGDYYKDGTSWSANVANAADPDDMTLVFDGQISQAAAGTAANIASMEDMLPIIFDNNFTYTGDHLRMMVELQRSSATDVNLFAAFDNSTNPDAKFITFSTDSDLDDLDLVWRWSINTYGAPVIFFDVEKESAVATGTVTDSANGNPVTQACVTFTDGPVIYSTTTTADGTYEMPIYQADRTYSATVEADHYFAHNSENHTFSPTGDNVKNFELVYDGGTGISDAVIAADELIDVYTTAGVRIMERVCKADLARLDNGVYVIRTARGTFKLRK